MTPTTLLCERDGAVLWIRLHRPEARNGIDDVMREELIGVLAEADTDPEVRCLVVTGQGRDFCTGADLMPAGDRELATRRPLSPLDYTRAVGPWQRLFQTLWELDTPMVSAVNGTTAGAGWMLALLADLVVAARGARWVHAFSRRGMVPHAGDTYFLPRLLSFHRLNEAAMLGDGFTSEDLHGWGAVNRLVAAEEVEPAAHALAERLAAGPTRSLGLTKRLYRRSFDSDMATAFAGEAFATALVSQTHDRQEGVQALLEGRAPEFTGT